MARDPQREYHIARAVWLYQRLSLAMGRDGRTARAKVRALTRRLTSWLSVADRADVKEYYHRINTPTCAFGEPFPCGPCADCLAESDRLQRAFEADVAAGVYDAEGYTPAERRAQDKRAEARAALSRRAGRAILDSLTDDERRTPVGCLAPPSGDADGD